MKQRLIFLAAITFVIMIHTAAITTAINPRILFVERIRFLQGDAVTAGDTLRAVLEVENEGDKTLYGTSVMLAIPELGIHRRQGRVDMTRGEVTSRDVQLDIPADIPEGWYMLRVFVSDDDSIVSRKLYRWIYIKFN